MEEKGKIGHSAGAYLKQTETIRKEKVNMDLRSPVQIEGKVDLKTKALEEQHKALGDWFEVVEEDQPTYQSTMVWDVTKGAEPMTEHQMVWDLATNCYHELPVQQVPSFLPAYHQLYPCPPSQQKEEESVVLAPTGLPLVNLFGGVFMEFVDTLYTSTLVQSLVCENNTMSEHRLAAEVLARSNLNPNAKEFNPSQDLKQAFVTIENTNHARCGDQGEVFSVEDVTGRTTSGGCDEEKDSGIVSKLEERGYESELDTSSPIGIHKVPLEAPCDNSACDRAFEGPGQEEEEEGEEVVVVEQEEENKEDECDTEVHLLRWNQDEDDDEEDGWWDKHPNDKEQEDKDDKDKDVEGQDKEDDDWWDSEEEPCTPSQVIDPAEFEDLFCCPLSLSSLHPTKPSTPSTKPTTPPPSPSSSPTPPSSSFTSVATISLASAPPTRAETNLARVNRAFNEKYSAPGNLGERKLGKVRFSDQATWQVIEEPEDLAEDLCEARCSDLEQRRADRERMERLLGPVFAAVHRRKMFCKIYGSLEEEEEGLG